MDQNLQDLQNLQELEKTINASAWLRDNDPEPRIGNPNCPAEADECGVRGESVYTAFVKQQDDGTYGCKYEACRAYSTRTLDDAVRHQRHHHFNHSPFACVPASGNTWYVSSSSTYPQAGWFLVDPLFQPSPLPCSNRPHESPAKVPALVYRCESVSGLAA